MLDDLLASAVEAVRGVSAPEQADTAAMARLMREGRTAIRRLYRRIYERVLPAFARDSYDRLTDAGEERKAPSEEVEAGWLKVVDTFLEGEGGKLIQGVSQETIALVVQEIREGVEEGEGIEAIARRLEEEVGGFNRVRARRIARSEVIRASNKGALEGARSTGLELEKEWVATRDSRTRGTHRRADGQTVGLEEAFEVGGFPAPYPAAATLPPSESVNCRCTVGFIPVEGES